jgi:2-polyprenyl-3-methyl-5-hydroxy-6-metoxy-1,4-benzoquinol methylase
MKVKIRLDKYYRQFNDLLPRQGKILDIGCGYGFMSYMLHFTGAEREITGIDYDEEKIATANHCFSKNENISFYYKDVLDFSFEKYKGIVISDVLHYLQPAEQKLVLERCIDNLLPGGVLIIRDGDRDMEEKHKGTKLTELFSTKILNFNKTKPTGLSFISGKEISDIAKEHNMEFSRIDETKYTSNVIFVLKKVVNEI